MVRYLLILFIFLSYGLIAQENTYSGQNIDVKLFSSIDLERNFGVTDNEIKPYFIDALKENNLVFTEDDYNYYFSLSHGWKKSKNVNYKVDNFRGLLIETGTNGIVAEFNVSKTKYIRESVNIILDKLVEMNADNTEKKFIDISDHFMKMEMNSWDSSRPDSHAPSSIHADHTHMRGGIMLGYKFSFSDNNKIYNRNKIVSNNVLFPDYENVFESSNFSYHTFEFMYGLSDKLTIFSKLDYIDNQITYSDVNLNKSNIYSSGLGDVNLQFLYSLVNRSYLKLHTNIGFDFPTGEFRASDELPYNMYTGKGYFSSILGFTSFLQFPKISAGIQPIINLPLNMNSNNFNLGVSADIYYWFSLKLNKMISVSYSQNYIMQSKVNGSFLFLIPEKNSDFDIRNTGYNMLNNSFGLNISPPKGGLKNIRFSAEYVLPLYQSYNGHQSRKINDFILSLQYSPGGHMGH